MTITIAAAFFIMMQVAAHLDIYRSRKAIYRHRAEINSTRKALLVSEKQRERIKARMQEVQNNPETSDNPDFELQKCKAFLKNTPDYHAMLESEIKRQRRIIDHTIKRIRVWQKLIILRR